MPREIISYDKIRQSGGCNFDCHFYHNSFDFGLAVVFIRTHEVIGCNYERYQVDNLSLVKVKAKQSVVRYRDK